MRTLEERLLETKGQLAQAVSQNEKLTYTLREAREPATAAGHGLLTGLGRETLLQYSRGGRVVFQVDRAADIRQALKLAERAGFKPVIAGGSEAWLVAGELARAQVPVLVDALVNLPQRFDHLAATLDNAARLHAAGVPVMFSQSGDATHNARKIRQLAGNAVANGLPWEAGLAGLTRIPAQTFGVDDRLGSIEVGKQADLVLLEANPLLDVRHAREIQGLFTHGRWYTESDLERLRREARERVASPD